MEHAPHTLPPHERHCPGGCTSQMIDHSSVLGVLHEILGPEVRCEAAGHRWREKGERDNNTLHRGGSPRGRVDPVAGNYTMTSSCFRRNSLFFNLRFQGTACTTA